MGAMQPAVRPPNGGLGTVAGAIEVLMAFTDAAPERGVTDRVVFATATGADGQAVPGLAEMARPGTRLALYMAVRQAPRIAADLMAEGLPGTTPVEVVAAATTPAEQRLETTLERVAADMAAQGIDSPAVILVTIPKQAAATSARRSA